MASWCNCRCPRASIRPAFSTRSCPAKDVDAFHPENVGRIVQGRPLFLPCTPHGIQQILLRHQIPTAGAHVVIVGRSEIVGKPIAMMLMQKGPGGDATVTVCHSRSRDLPSITRAADILIVAIGRPNFVTAEMVKPGAAVIDVGINRTEKGLVGDVDFGPVSQVAGAITPVPGGVGPLTITMLLQNTLLAARLQTESVPGVWPDGFFESIRIDASNFVRPDQGRTPPAHRLD